MTSICEAAVRRRGWSAVETMNEPATPRAEVGALFTVDNLKWLIEKLTLPLVLAAITIVFQWSASQRSGNEIAAANKRAQDETAFGSTPSYCTSARTPTPPSVAPCSTS